MTYFCSTSASSQPQLLGGQRVQAPNPVGFPGTWPLPGSPLLMACPDITQPGSTSLPETPRLFPLLPLRPPGPSHMVSHAPAPPVSFPVPYPPGGPVAPCSSVLPTTGILTPHPGQSSFHESLFWVIASPTPPTTLGVFLQVRG